MRGAHPDAGGSRFPLAAKALRGAMPAATRTRLPVPAGSDDAAAPCARATTRAPRNWPLFVFLILLPLQNITAGYLPNIGGGFNFLNVMFLISLFTAMAQGGKLAPNEPVNTWTAVYAIYMTLSLLVGFHFVDDPANHFNQLKDHMVGLFVVYVVQMSVRDWKGVRLVVLATLLPLPYIAKVVWTQHRSVASTHYTDDLRISGTFALLGANEFAAFCVTVAVVLFAVLLACQLSRKWKIVLMGGIGCMIVGVLYAYSRTAYISLIMGMVVVIMVWRGRLKLILPLCLAVVVLPAVLPASVVERFDSTTVEEGKRDESTELRIEYWKIAWANFLRNPVVGTGYHTFHHREINPYGRDTHNLYIRMLSEGGVFGAIALLGILIAVLRTAMREVREARTGTWRYALALGMMGAWVSMVIANLFGDRFTYYPVIAYFWAYVGLVVKARHLPPEDSAR